MTTATVTFATYAAEVAAQDGTTNEMAIAATTTMVVTTAGYFDGGWIVSDQSAALETYTGAATDAEVTTAEDYTDGYAIVAGVTLSRADFEPTVASAGDYETTASDMYNDICVTGSMTAANSGTDTEIKMISCARLAAACTNPTASDTDVTCVYSYSSRYNPSLYASTTNADWTAATWAAVTTQTGFAKSWRVAGMPATTTVAAASSTASTGVMTIARFLPHVEKSEYAAADLRMDGTITGQVGYLLDSGTTTTWSGTWKSAAQVASVAAAAAVVALTF